MIQFVLLLLRLYSPGWICARLFYVFTASKNLLFGLLIPFFTGYYLYCLHMSKPSKSIKFHDFICISWNMFSIWKLYLIIHSSHFLTGLNIVFRRFPSKILTLFSSFFGCHAFEPFWPASASQQYASIYFFAAVIITFHHWHLKVIFVHSDFLPNSSLIFITLSFFQALNYKEEIRNWNKSKSTQRITNKKISDSEAFEPKCYMIC